MKKIVVLSDGTGNSAAKRHRTNVWRLYEALDVNCGNQIALYDDGVGSQDFWLFKVLGGAFGWGLAKNVVQIYEFLCRNYKNDPDDGPDEIYLFGFSRGAFTVRMLAGMISHCGLYTDFADEDDLRKTAQQLFRKYRSRLGKGWLTYPFRLCRRIYCGWRLGTKNTDCVRIEFIGVWDTVEAYGFPIEEMAMLWDRFIFPLRFVNSRLPDNVKRACHALSVDEERHTFDPVLWDESPEESERIEQVWFAGVHSDVGGGYPKNSLALVPLDWMISKVEYSPQNGAGLKFINRLRREFKSRAHWHGTQHDSRSGIRAFYRYRPRNISSLCKRCGITSPKIHVGVLERIRHNFVPYAPTALPESFALVKTGSSQPLGGGFALSQKARSAMNAALDMVFWRRWLYFAFLSASVTFLLSPSFLSWSAHGPCVDTACVAEPLLKLAISVLPDFAGGWIQVLREHPIWLWGVVLAVFVLICLKRRLARATHLRAMAAWSTLKRGRNPTAPTKVSLTSRLRGLCSGKLRLIVKCFLPSLLFVVIFVFLIRTVDRAALSIRLVTGSLCQQSDNVVELIEPEQRLTFSIDDPCWGTGILLVEGLDYRFEVENGQNLMDGGSRANADGVLSPTCRHYLGIPMRRHVLQPWLKLMGKVGARGAETIAIGSGPIDYTPKSDGELFLYVNDAVFGVVPGRHWALPYSWSWGENKGQVTLTIRRL